MNSAEQTLAQLGRLQQQGALPRSQCGAGFLRAVEPLLASGVISEERAGAGRCIVVRDTAALGEFVRHHFPGDPVPSDSISRAVGVARFRDSKAYASDTPWVVSVRAWDESALRKDGRSLCAAAATAAHGVFSFVLQPDSKFTLHGPCALVENPAVFHHFERLGLNIGLAMLGQGRIPGRALDWLAAMQGGDYSLLHLPDYDPVGLSEFERLHGRLGGRAQLHLPSDLEKRFQRHANRKLLERPNSRSLMLKLRQSPLPDVRRVIALMDLHNAGLEQESLLIGAY